MNSGKIVSQLNDDGVFVGTTVADESPLEPGVFLIPSGCVEADPLPEVEGKGQRYVDGAFHYFDKPVTQVIDVEPPFEAKAAAYLAGVRELREQILSRLAGIGFDAIAAGQSATVSAIATARQRMKDLPLDPAVLAAIAAKDLGALDTAVRNAYRAAVAVTDESVISAFNGFDL